MTDIRTRIDDAAWTWEKGFAIVAADLNRLFSELFPHSECLRLELKVAVPHHGLEYHRAAFKELLVAELLHSIPSEVKLVTNSTNSFIADPPAIAMRDGDEVFPWSIGMVSLGNSGKDLDQESRDIRNQLRRSDHSEDWFRNNVSTPTQAHALAWRTHFHSWFNRYGKPSIESGPKPRWNPDTGELTFRNEVVKRVSRLKMATNVVTVLGAFQESDWPPRIDDPLTGGKNPTRLHDTVKSLNTGLVALHFRADGSGEGYRWERA